MYNSACASENKNEVYPAWPLVDAVVNVVIQDRELPMLYNTVLACFILHDDIGPQQMYPPSLGFCPPEDFCGILDVNVQLLQ